MKIDDKIAKERYLQKIAFAKSAGAKYAHETPQQRKEAIELCKNDPRKMVERYFPHYADAPCADFQIEWAWAVEKDTNFRGFCQWGRALAKSVWNDIFIPFWLWLRGEPVYLVIIGNSFERAVQLLEDLKAEFEANPRIIGDFGEQKQLGTWEEGFFITKGGFIGQALGMGQNVRGLRIKNLRPSHIVADDLESKELIKNPRRQNEYATWIEQDLIPTMDGKRKRFIQANNRFAPVMIQTILQEKHPKWKVHQVNAFDPVTFVPTWAGKYDNDYFHELVYGDNGIGELAANAEYNNSPHVEGVVFKDGQFQWAELPALHTMEYIIGHWDIAYAGNSRSDYNAVVVQGLKDKHFYVVDCFCRQTKMRAAVEWMCDFQKTLPANVVVHWQYESQFWNDEVQRVLQEVQAEKGVYLSIIKRTLDRAKKIDRIMSLQPYYQNGRIFYNQRLKGSVDMQTGLGQLKGIEPNYKVNDDFPDAHQICTTDLEAYMPNRSFKALMGKMLGTHRW
ncbi:hypothetical protein ACF3OE_06495 [Capnocytophaga canis]|uniref:hypothetical protein n=1 Tax=Capnocytophaga canis TaxID=1848903 RepID=UPI00370DDE24